MDILHKKVEVSYPLGDNDRYIDESKDILKSLLNDKFSCCRKQTLFLLLRAEVVIRQQTIATCNATLLRDKLQENVARITWPQNTIGRLSGAFQLFYFKTTTKYC